MKEKLLKDKEQLEKAIEQGTAQLNFMIGQKAYIDNLLIEFDKEDGKKEEEKDVLKPE